MTENRTALIADLERGFKHEQPSPEVNGWNAALKWFRDILIRKHASQAEGDAPVAMRYGWDGYGYQYINSASGSDWETRHADAEPLYLRPAEKAADEPECDCDVFAYSDGTTYKRHRCRKATEARATEPSTSSIGVESCTCGQAGCSTYWLTGIGSFCIGSGFTKMEAERIAAALSAQPSAQKPLEEENRRLRAALRFCSYRGRIEEVNLIASRALSATQTKEGMPDE